MDKFGRNYVLTVQANDNSGDVVTIAPPFTLELDIQRSELSSANISRFRVYNLGPLSRNRILQDQYDPKGLKVNLNAGYGVGPNWPLVFSGIATKSTSFREGNNFVSQLECFDGGNVYTSAVVDGLPPFPAGTPYQVIINKLVSLLDAYGVKPGKIGRFPGVAARGYPVSGNIIDAIKQIAGQNSFFIDKGLANVLNTNEGIGDAQVAVISSDTGLLGTPLREETLITLEILFEPSFSIGQIVSLQSSTGSNYNGQYKIASVSHRGMISEAICGDLVTKITLFYQKAITPVL